MKLYLEALRDLGGLIFAFVLVGVIFLIYGIPSLLDREKPTKNSW